MSTPVDILVKVQDMDILIQRLRREIDDIPAREKEIAEGSARQKADLETAREELKQVQARGADLELEIKTHREHISKLRTQQLELKTNKEFKAMEGEISNIETKISDIEDRELSLYDETDAASEKVKTAEADVARAEGETRLEIEDLLVRKKEIEEELGKIQAERDELAATADARWLSQYERIFANKGDAALVSVEGGSCGGCHMKLPPSVYHRARVHDTMVSCDFCGRLLY